MAEHWPSTRETLAVSPLATLRVKSHLLPGLHLLSTRTLLSLGWEDLIV